MRVIWSRKRSRRFFSRRNVRSSLGEIQERAIDEIVEVRMLHSQFDQLARQGVQVVVHGRLRTRD